VATGFAAHLDPAQAALAAVTEMVQAETAMAQAAAAKDPDYLTWRDHANLTMPQFQPQATTAARAKVTNLTTLLHHLAALGLRALVVDLTLPADPQPTVRVLVPGLCALQGRIQTHRFTQLTGRSLPVTPLAIEPY
jgi:ribosomal protein S12 methylthiotransferase accessory factor YcaO